MEPGICQHCNQQTLVGPLHGEKGGPKFCIPCGTEWYGKYNRRRKIGRIIIKAMKAYIKEGGNSKDFDKMALASLGFDFTHSWEANTIGSDINDITTELLEATLRLTHPDRHPPERQAEAHRVTQELLTLKPYTFPEPKPTLPPTLPPSLSERLNRPSLEPLKMPLRPDYPCELCANTTPFHYCAACRAKWEENRTKEKEQERAKRRAQYQRRKKNRGWREKPKTCPVCGQPFKGKRKDSVYCSDSCRQRHHRQRVTDTVDVRASTPESRYMETAP